MAWDVRPTRDLDEFKRAVGAIGHYFGGWPAGRRGRAAVLEQPAVRADARRVRRRPDRRRRGRVPVRADRSRRHGPLRRRHGRRRPADSPSPRHPDGDDARPARGHPRARASRSPRSGPRRRSSTAGSATASRRSPCEMALPSGYAGLREPPDDRATRPPRPARGVEGRVRRRSTTASALRTPGMFARTDTWWETRNLPDPPDRRQGGGEKNALVLELDGEPAGYALYRIHTKFESGAAAGHVDVIEAVADGPRGDARALAGAPRHGLEGDAEGLHAPDRPPAHAPARPIRAGCSCASATGSGSGSSTSVRRCRRGHTPTTRPSCSRSKTRSCRRTPAAGGSAAGRRSGRTTSRIWRSAIGELGSAYLGGFGFGELVRAGVVRELKEGGAARADVLFQTGASKPWCPEIF